MKLFFLAVLLALAGCSTSTTSTESSDTSGVVTDTMAMAASDSPDDAYQEEAHDTTYTLDLSSAFTSPQLNERVAYVYSTSGLDVFETTNGGKVVGHIDYKSRVDLSESLINSVPSDTIMMDGLRGHLVPIIHEQKTAFIFSGYLVNLPVPDKGNSVIDYFNAKLHLLKPVTRKETECDCDMAGGNEVYEYENGITVNSTWYYEGGGMAVNFQNRMTLQEVFLFAAYFYDRMAKEVPEIPKGAFEVEKEGQVTIKVAAKGESITDITVITEEGCYEEEGIHLSADHIQMSASGGC